MDLNKRTKELEEVISSSKTFTELLTKLYQNRPLHVNSDTDVLEINLKLTPNKFVKKNIGKNINRVNAMLEISINNPKVDHKIISKISFNSEGDSVSSALNGFTNEDQEILNHILNGENVD